MTSGSNFTLEQAVLALAERQPLLRARDLTEQSLPTVVLSRLVTAGKLERLARGVYSLPGRALSEHRSLAEVALRVPRGVVCLCQRCASTASAHRRRSRSGWRFLTTRQRPAWTSRCFAPHVGGRVDRRYRTGPDRWREGTRVQRSQDGRRLFQVSQQDRLEALRDGWSQRKLTMDALWHYATVDRVANVMRPYLESVPA